MYVRTAHSCSEEILRVENLTRKGFFENVSFTLHKGEILGFAGLIGAGRTEIVKSLIGADPLDSGKVFVNGKPEVIRSPMEAIDNGIGLIPEDRRNEGIVKCRSIRDNISYTILEKLSHWGIISAGKLASKTNHLMEQLEIRAPGVYSLVGQLSGGNQQKVVVAKWLAADCNVLIMDEPTRGVDVGAKAEIYGLMDELTRKGHGIILISSELPEVMGMSDRILVVSEGRITCEVDPRTTTEEEILAHALPLHDTDVRPGKEEKYEG